MSEPVTVRKTPCPSCPYRRDVPSGIWDAAEYEKLPVYDQDIPEQVTAGATGLFHCHQRTGELCAGWAGCHDLTQTFAARLNHPPPRPVRLRLRVPGAAVLFWR